MFLVPTFPRFFRDIIAFDWPHNIPLRHPNFWLTVLVQNRDGFKIKKSKPEKIETQTKPLDLALKSMAEEFLNYNNIDWYNNDGGFGYVEFSVDEELLKLRHNERVMSTTCVDCDF